MFYESLYDFSEFEVWSISPFITWKQQDLGYAYIQRGKTAIWDTLMYIYRKSKNNLMYTLKNFFAEHFQLFKNCYVGN